MTAAELDYLLRYWGGVADRMYRDGQDVTQIEGWLREWREELDHSPIDALKPCVRSSQTPNTPDSCGGGGE